MIAVAFPIITIVTPTYNQAEFLAETIESVLNQTYPNIEYIVLNDGSSDGTEEILKRYEHLIKWESQPNIGQARTLNKGWDMARGKYLAYLSSDDVLHPSAISDLVAILEGGDEIVCAYPDANLINEKSLVVKENVCKEFDLEELIVCQECYIGPGAIFRANAYQQVGGWKANLKLAPDREFWMRLGVYGKFYFEKKVLAGYRVHSGSISYKDVSEEVSREYIKVLDDYFSGNNISSTIQMRKSEAYGRAKFIVSRNLFRSGRFKRGYEVYSEACRDFSDLKEIKYIFQLLRNILGKPVRIALGRLKGLL